MTDNGVDSSWNNGVDLSWDNGMDSLWEKLAALKNAKSKVWNYFGFPAYSFNTIIDIKKVYCKLCDFLFPMYILLH